MVEHATLFPSELQATAVTNVPLDCPALDPTPGGSSRVPASFHVSVLHSFTERLHPPATARAPPCRKKGKQNAERRCSSAWISDALAGGTIPVKAHVAPGLLSAPGPSLEWSAGALCYQAGLTDSGMKLRPHASAGPPSRLATVALESTSKTRTKQSRDEDAAIVPRGLAARLTTPAREGNRPERDMGQSGSPA